MGGPYLDDTGRMIIGNFESMEEAEQVANANPTVQAALQKSRPYLARCDG
jgi:uncharacterized protein YciI